MSQKTIILFVVLFSLVVLGMFVYAYLKQTELNTSPSAVVTEPAEEPLVYPEVTRIDGTHYFIDGVHTVVGEILLPTPCDLLEVESTVMESFPEQIRLDFTVLNNADMCAQVITAQRFKVSATASEQATFSATFMGRDIPLNLKPAPAGETPDEFEVFIKG